MKARTQQEQNAYENARDCLYYGYGRKHWNSCGLSEKALAVVGDTRAIKDTLKAIGGRFNAHLTCGAGWIFSKSKEAAIREALNI